MRLEEGQLAPEFEVKDVFGTSISLSSFTRKPIMLSFYRFSSCPLCNFRVHQLTQLYPDFQKKGLQMITFWQSPQESILEHVGQQRPPFPLIADPSKIIYKRYGVEKSWLAAAKLLLLSPATLYRAKRFGRGLAHIDGEKQLVPADFLIGPDLVIKRAYYGKHIGDHLPVTEIEDFLNKPRVPILSTYKTTVGGIL